MRRDRSTDDAFIDQLGAAQHLGVPPKVLKKLVSQGILEPVRRHGRTFFYLSDVNAAAHVIIQRIDVVTANKNAIRALALAERTTRQVTDMLRTFHVDFEHSEISEEAVLDALEKAHTVTIEELQNLSAEEVAAWAAFFFRLDVGFFVFASYVMGTAEPWVPFMNLGHAMLRAAPTHKTPDLNAAYSYLHATIRWMRNGAYLYCRNINGTAVANRIFPDEHDPSIVNSLLAFVAFIEGERRSNRLH